MCIFCDIVEGKIPSYKVYEDDSVMAFLDISQTTKGHTLVIPKKHYETFLDIDAQTLAHLIQVAQKISKQLVDKLNCAGMNILSNVNEVAGQEVNHFHIHLIPRYSKNDNIKITFEANQEVNMEQTLKKILGD